MNDRTPVMMTFGKKLTPVKDKIHNLNLIQIMIQYLNFIMTMAQIKIEWWFTIVNCPVSTSDISGI